MVGIAERGRGSRGDVLHPCGRCFRARNRWSGFGRTIILRCSGLRPAGNKRLGFRLETAGVGKLIRGRGLGRAFGPGKMVGIVLRGCGSRGDGPVPVIIASAPAAVGVVPTVASSGDFGCRTFADVDRTVVSLGQTPASASARQRGNKNNEAEASTPPSI